MATEPSGKILGLKRHTMQSKGALLSIESAPFKKFKKSLLSIKTTLSGKKRGHFLYMLLAISLMRGRMATKPSGKILV